MTNIELANKALEVYNNRDAWTYVQGGLGELASSARIKGLYTYYRGKGNGSTCDYSEWLTTYGTTAAGAAKQCTDCSNFIQYLINSGKNAAASYYTNMQDAGNDIFIVPVGTILLIPNKHVGIVVQQGERNANGAWKTIPEAIDFYAYNNTCRKGSYINSTFSKAVYLTGIDYITKPSESVAPVKIDAAVTGTHYVGETLSAKDFTIKITMSDGSQRINPPGWYATPLLLSSTKNTITVGYEQIKTTILCEAIGKEAEPVSMTAAVNAPHKVGDTLKASDFTVIVTMSDGSILTNPPNWAASPLKITNDIAKIKVTYKNIYCTIPVQYMAMFG